MSNFPLVWSSGAPFEGIFESAKATTIDGRFPRISNWKEGSDHTLDASAVVALRGTVADSNNLLLDLPVEIPQDQTLSLTGASGHPAKLSVGNFCTIDVLSGGTTKIESGGTLTALAGSTVTVASVLGTQYTGTQPTKTADPGANNIAIATNQIKAWGCLTIGNDVFTINDGMNVASVASSDGATLTLVSFARNINTNYSVVFGDSSNTFHAVAISKTASSFKIWLVDTSTWGPTPLPVGSGHPTYEVDFQIVGRQ